MLMSLHGKAEVMLGILCLSKVLSCRMKEVEVRQKPARRGAPGGFLSTP